MSEADLNAFLNAASTADINISTTSSSSVPKSSGSGAPGSGFSDTRIIIGLLAGLYVLVGAMLVIAGIKFFLMRKHRRMKLVKLGLLGATSSEIPEASGLLSILRTTITAPKIVPTDTELHMVAVIQPAASAPHKA